MRVLVCGGRDFADMGLLLRTLNFLHHEREVTVLIEGEAQGADILARQWATACKIKVERFPADWKNLGRRAGYIRNKQMLDEGKPDLVVAFPGGRGTDMMVEIAECAGVEIMKVSL